MATTLKEYTGDGTTDVFNVVFPYIDKTHVRLLISGVEDTAKTWVNDTQVKASSVPASGAKVIVKRVTPTAPLVDYQDGSTLTEADLDLGLLQALYVSEEGFTQSGTAMNLNAAGNFTAAGKKIVDVASPTTAGGVVTKGYLDASYVPTMENLRDQAASSESAAEISANNAASSASAASTSETNAATSANNAASSASAASTSETNAATSATNASNSAAAAATSETNAATSETNAASSASAAATSETNAASSATTASNEADYAKEWANKGSGLLVSAAAGGDGVDDYSALHHANQAATSATNASNSASAAATSETNAATSATNASNSASAASTSETNAAASETQAQKWAENAEDTQVTTGSYSALHWAAKSEAVRQLEALTYTELKAFSSNLTTNGRVALVASRTSSNREGGGTFIFDTSNLSAKVSADPGQGQFVPPNYDTTGTSGAWVRKGT